MDDMISTYNCIFPNQESRELVEYFDGDLASSIFSMTDANLYQEQKDILSSLVETVPAISEMLKGLRKTNHLRLIFSDEVKKKLADGTYKLMQRKDLDGVFKAVVVDSKGKTRAIADIKVEELGNGVDPARIASAMQGMAIQQQLRDIAGQLEEMSAAMEDIIMGQHNDRLALYYSGEAMFRESLTVNDPALKKQLMAASVLELTNAINSLQITLTYTINEICTSYNRSKGKFDLNSNVIREKMFLINSSFQTIHKANTLKVAIYYNQGEYAALTSVLSDYHSFIERTLTDERSHILYLADPNEKRIDGIWNSRHNDLPLKIMKAKSILNKPEEYVLDIKKEELV